MSNWLVSEKPVFLSEGLLLVRVITGGFLAFHGWEIFDGEVMNGYLEWDQFKGTSGGRSLVYAGKFAELLAGVLLTVGLFTRLAAIIAMGTLAYIAFFIGHGKVWYEDQHPFLFVLLAFVFLISGGGRWSADHFLFNRKTKSHA